MREFIKTEEFRGKLKLGDKFKFDNVRCVFEYDVYSNETMKGKFIIEDDQRFDFFHHFPTDDLLTYTDKDGREIHADYNGSSMEHKYNSHRIVIKFTVKEYGQLLKYSNKANKNLFISFDALLGKLSSSITISNSSVFFTSVSIL